MFDGYFSLPYLHTGYRNLSAVLCNKNYIFPATIFLVIVTLIVSASCFHVVSQRPSQLAKTMYIGLNRRFLSPQGSPKIAVWSLRHCSIALYRVRSLALPI